MVNLGILTRSALLLVLFLSVPATPLVADDGADGALKEIIGQIAAEPGLKVAGEPVFMAGELLRFYRERGYAPLWRTDDHRGRAQIRTALRHFGETPDSGLCGADYHLPFFRELLSHFTIEEHVYGLPLLRWSGWYDILLTDALFHYFLHMIEGRVPSDAIQEGWDLRKEQVAVSRVIRFAFENDQLDKVLRDLQPDHEHYRALKQALERYREVAAMGGWPTIPAGEPIHPGMSDARLPLLRTRLLLSGDLEQVPAGNPDNMADGDAAALRRFQRRHGLAADGVLGEGTRAALNVPVTERVRQIEINLERWRWLPKTLGRNYLLVNIADFSVALVENAETILAMPAVVGNHYRKTPVFSAWLEYIEFAPYWYVPKTILVEDKLPLIRRNPAYIDENHYELVAWDRETLLDPAEIDWETVGSDDFPGLLRQKPGPWNALGRVKFMLPNRYAVYLHDTNERHHFWQRNRPLSSGCIRLKRPEVLARHLLEEKGWGDTDIAEAMAAGTPQRVYLERPLPVHVLYWTAWVDDNDRVNFREDIYGRDRDLLQALFAAPSGCTLHRLASAPE